ncbi:MAG: T9SS type A sorting domain-containing protein [Bacteroidetes bacterium]|nr:T9SS type A sorting domain-containing protein [Bacteroidota bacterium]
MKRLLLSFFATFPFLVCLQAQQYDQIWMYGGESNLAIQKVAKLVFVQDTFYAEPTEFKGYFWLFSAAMSDTSGGLMFYSNGCNVYNRYGEIMENGDTINGPANSYWADFCDSYTGYKTSFFALPSPAGNMEFYIIHQKFYNTGSSIMQGLRELMYSKIDMRNGMGKLVEKNVDLIYEHRFEACGAVRHGNGRDWWIILPHDLKPYYYKFLLTPAGFQGPFEQYDPDKLIDSVAPNHKICFTPDGSKMIHYHARAGIWVYDFDRCTGQIGAHPVHIPFPEPGPGGWQGLDCEVSGNSRYLYFTASGFTKIMQYDLWAADILSSGDSIGIYDGYKDQIGQSTVFGRMQRGPNGKIYISPGSSYFLHVINHPNLPGAACGLVQREITLPTWNLSTLPYYPNYRLFDLNDSVCDTLGINTVSVLPVDEAPTQASLFPNPASDQFTIYLPGWEGRGVLMVHNALGQLSFQAVLSRSSTTVECASWPSGVYGVQVWRDGRLLLGRQLVLEHGGY